MRSIAVVFLFACSAGTMAQSLTFAPSPAYEGNRVAFNLGITSCPLAPVLTGVFRAGNQVTATYVLVNHGGGCFAASAPSSMQGDLGAFAPGTYELRVWHEALKGAPQKITVVSGKPTEINFQLK